MKQEIIKENNKLRLVLETNCIVPPFSVFVVETLQGNMLFNTTDETEALNYFKEESR